MSAVAEDARTAQLLRISCSDIAAATGFHPWAKLDELFEKYLYQDLDELLVQDAENLDTEFLTTEQEVQKILQKIDAQEKGALNELDAATKDGSVLNNNSKAEEMIKQIQELMKSSGVLNKISTTELKLVENEFRGRVRKNYGINCENKSLDKYEEIIGFPVGDRNLEIIKMKVMPLDEGSSGGGRISRAVTMKQEEEETEASVDAFSVLLNGSRKLSQDQAQAAQQGGIKRRRTVTKPSFLLVGRVDGISHQLDLRNDDPTQWNRALRVVVEMKSRVRGISSPPPLYEQIQLVSYMIMLECDCGDLVQAVARASIPSREERVETTVTTSTIEGDGSSTTAMSVSTSHVSVTVQEGCSSEGCGSEGCSGAFTTVSSATTTTVSARQAGGSQTTVASTMQFSVGCSITADDESHRKSNNSVGSSAGGVINELSVEVDQQSQPQPPQQTRPSRPRRTDATTLYAEEDFQVNRVMLDGPPFYHRKYWDIVVMPRLRTFRDAVYTMRCDDALRYAYLMSTTEAKLQMLQNLCPYFDL